MDFLINHWGGLASVIGVVVSVIGLGWAIREARKARAAAQSAEEMAEAVKLEALESIGRHFLAVEIERAIALIQRLKLLHSTGRWEAALEQYQTLRALTSSIIARSPEQERTRRERLVSSRALISDMESYVDSRDNEELRSEGGSTLNQQLNAIQSDLEDMATATGFGGP